MEYSHLSIDIETFSSVDLKKSGLYRYVQSPDFQILLFAFSYNDDPVNIIDLVGGSKFDRVIPSQVIKDINNPDVIKHAYNAAFEWYCLSKHFKFTPHEMNTTLAQWRCTQLHGLYCGYPLGLANIGKAIGLPQERQKLTTGKALIKYFCTPCKPTKNNGNRTRNLPHHDLEKWELFKEYCKQDVVTEKEVENILSSFPVPDNEQLLWRLDQQINAVGVKVDKDLIEGALFCSNYITHELMDEAFKITGLDNPNSVKQLTKWLEDETGKEINDLQKDTVKDLIKAIDNEAASRMLEIRQELSKTSVKKYASMDAAICNDDRVRGLLQFYGANRTGRWAGRLVQVQNLPRNYIDTLSTARRLVKDKKVEAIKLIYGNVPDTLSQLIRTAFIPSKGNVFLVADFSAIEARVIAWLAGEQWRQDVFKTHGKIYEASASAMFGVPIETIVKGHKNYSLRQKGKVAELALGYQGSSGALIKMGALNMGLTEEELPEIVKLWRSSNKRIVDLWYSLENAALEVMHSGKAIGLKGLIFAHEYDPNNNQDFLTVQLPSGRKLFYVKPFIGSNDWDKEAICYWGQEQTSKKWTKLQTYGGKLTENIVQAIARDCLAESMKKLSVAGYQTVMHVHDEVILDVNITGLEDLDNILKYVYYIMGEPIPWAPGLLLKADGFKTEFYKKD